MTRWLCIAGLLFYVLLPGWMSTAQDTATVQVGLPYQGTAANATRTEHQLTLNEGDIITVVLNSDDFDPVLQLEQAGVVWLIVDDVGDTTDVAVNNYRVPVSGTYILAVLAFADRPYSGNYTLLVAQGDAQRAYRQMDCPLALPSPFNVNSVAQIPEDSSERQLYDEPSIHAQKVGRVAVGTTVILYEGPECEEGALWWWVQYGETNGWLMESNYGEYWLVPLTPRANPVLLMNGIGRSNNQAVTNGEFQVEYYCRQIGYSGTGQNDENWFCTNNSGQRAYTLGQEDFDRICQETYNREDAFALQNGTNPTPAFRWLCYASGG